MYCKYCGKVIDDNSVFCKYCGGNLDFINKEENINNTLSSVEKQVISANACKACRDFAIKNPTKVTMFFDMLYKEIEMGRVSTNEAYKTYKNVLNMVSKSCKKYYEVRFLEFQKKVMLLERAHSNNSGNITILSKEEANSTAKELPKEKNGKFIIILGIVLFLVVLPIFCGVLFGDSETGGAVVTYSPQTITINDIEFIFTEYTVYSKQPGDNVIVCPVTINNKNEKDVVLDDDDFMIDNTKRRALTTTKGYYNGSLVVAKGKSCSTILLFTSPKGDKISDLSIEVDLSIISFGKNVYLKDLYRRENNNESFNEFYLSKNGANQQHVQLIDNIIENENLGMLQYFTYEYFETDKEHDYVVVTGAGEYGIIFDINNKFTVFDLNGYYTMYNNSVKNDYYVSKKKMNAKIETLKQGLETTLESYYVQSDAYDFSWGRVSGVENALYIKCILKGVNSYGMTIYKNVTAYYDYNREEDVFEVYYLAIDNSVQDDRYTIEFDTQCNQTVSNQKVSKNYYINEPVGLYNDGKRLIGWKISGTNEWFDFSDSPKGNMTLVAVWE